MKRPETSHGASRNLAFRSQSAKDSPWRSRGRIPAHGIGASSVRRRWAGAIADLRVNPSLSNGLKRLVGVLRSPSEQVGESQPGTAELIGEPDAEVVQRYPRRQTGSQSRHVVGSLPPEPKGVEEFVVDALDDLAYSGHPPPQALGPGFAAVALGRVDDACPVALQPAPMVFFAFKALVGYVGSRGHRAHARQPRVRSMPHGEEGLGHLLVGGRSRREADRKSVV